MQGVQVTIIGMILVFLTLLIAAVVIMVLDRIFRPKAKEAEKAAPVMIPVKPASVTPTATIPQDDLKAKAAAIAVAIALQARQRKSLQLPFQRLAKGEDALQDIPGEPVTVLTIDPGPATWRGYGRVKAMQ